MQFPHVTITSSQLSALIYLPDDQRGFYRGARFDWSGMVAQVSHRGHTFFGPLHDQPKPDLHDGVAGLAEEFGMFDPLGYDEVDQGGSFVKIGIGELHRPDSQPYSFGKAYPIQNPGIWQVRVGANMAHFEHTVEGPRGWGYHYTKAITLVDDAPVLNITRTLKNTGTKTIHTTHYNHNFLTFDGRSGIGPDYRLQFAWPLRAVEWKDDGPLRIDGSMLYVDRPVREKESLWALLEGYGPTPEHHGVRVFDPVTRMGIDIRGDLPLVRAVVWGTGRVICPELFVKIEVEPGQTMQWSHRYLFQAAQAE